MTAICKNLLTFAKFFRRHHPQSSESKSSFKKTHFEGWNLYLLSFDVDAAQFFELNIFRVQRYDRFRHYKKISRHLVRNGGIVVQNTYPFGKLFSFCISSLMALS